MEEKLNAKWLSCKFSFTEIFYFVGVCSFYFQPLELISGDGQHRRNKHEMTLCFQNEVNFKEFTHFSQCTERNGYLNFKSMHQFEGRRSFSTNSYYSIFLLRWFSISAFLIRFVEH